MTPFPTSIASRRTPQRTGILVTLIAGALATAWMPLGAMASEGASPAVRPDGDNKNEKRVLLAQAVKRSTLVFPFDKPTATIPNLQDVTELLTDGASSRLAASGNYFVSPFRRSLPSISRLVNEQQLSEADVDANKGFADNTRATKVTKAIGYEVAFVGSIDDYQYSEADKQVTITVSGRLLDVVNNKVIKSATLSATSSKGGNAKQEERSLEAARNVSEKLMAQLVPVQGTPVVPQGKVPDQDAPKKKRRNNTWLWGLLIVGVGLGLGLSTSGGGNGGSGGGGGVDSPPAPPRSK